MSTKCPVHTCTTDIKSSVHTSVYSNKTPGAVDFKGLEGCRSLYTLGRILYDSFFKQKNLLIKYKEIFLTREDKTVCTVCTVCTDTYKPIYFNACRDLMLFTLLYTPCTHLLIGG